jgi:hypothetical protein
MMASAMENVIEMLYFQPVNAHQYWHKQLIAEEEGASRHFPGVLRLATHIDYEDNLSLFVVFRREGEYHADRVLAYQAVWTRCAAGDPHKLVPSLAAAADACEEYWKRSIAGVFGRARVTIRQVLPWRNGHSWSGVRGASAAGPAKRCWSMARR